MPTGELSRFYKLKPGRTSLLPGVKKTPRIFCPVALTDSSDTSSGEEVKNEQYQGDYEQQVNQSTGDMKSKSTCPKEDENNGNNE